MALRNRLAPYRRLQLQRRNRPMESFREHEAIFEAIYHGDGALADRLLCGHIINQGGSFTDFIASLPREYVGAEPSDERRKGVGNDKIYQQRESATGQ